MRNTLSKHLKLTLLLLALVLPDNPSIAEQEHGRLLDKDHLIGDFGPYPHSSPKAQGKPKHGTLPQYSQVYKLPGARKKELSTTDINHLRKAKDGRWLFKSIDDEKLFLLLPREKVKKLLGVPRTDRGRLIEYNCRLDDSPGYLELFIKDELVQSSKIWIEEGYRQSKRK